MCLGPVRVRLSKYSLLLLFNMRMMCVQDRASGGISKHKLPFAKSFKALTDLEEIVEEIKPTALIGQYSRLLSRHRVHLLPLCLISFLS